MTALSADDVLALGELLREAESSLKYHEGTGLQSRYEELARAKGSLEYQHKTIAQHKARIAALRLAIERGS